MKCLHPAVYKTFLLVLAVFVMSCGGGRDEFTGNAPPVTTATVVRNPTATQRPCNAIGIPCGIAADCCSGICLGVCQ